MDDVFPLIVMLFAGFAVVIGFGLLLGEPDCEGMKGTNERIPAGCSLRPSR